ncbi:MAG: extracellular solute-binding protein [Desulfitobacterium hafniense]|nr:extracellular solute-binding protein [Desulfitobacterium hafniense]
MKNKKLLSIVALITVFALLLTGCAKGGGGGQAQGGKTTITFAHWRPEDTEAFKKIIAKFEEQNPNVKVEMTITPSANYIANLQGMLLSGEGVDVFTTFPGSQFETIYSSNAYSDLTNEGFVKNFEPALIKAGQKDGKQYAIPYQLVYNIPVYNKALFAKYNIEVPKDWDSFLKASETLKKNGIIPIAFSIDVSPQQFINSMIMNNAPEEDIFQKLEAGQTKLTDEWFIKSLGALKELKDKGYFQQDVPGTKADGALALFAQEKAAMLAAGSFSMATVKKQNPNIQQGLIAPITTTEDKAVWKGIHTSTFMLGINAKSKKQTEAKKFIEFLSNVDIASQYANETGQMVTVKGAKYSTPELQESGKWTSVKTRFQPMYTFKKEEIKTAIVTAVQKIQQGISVEQAAKEAQIEVDKVIKK